MIYFYYINISLKDLLIILVIYMLIYITNVLYLIIIESFFKNLLQYIYIFVYLLFCYIIFLHELLFII